MFVVLRGVAPNYIEHFEYFTKLNMAVNAATARFRKDGELRWVATWPDREVLWSTEHIPKFDGMAHVAEVFGRKASLDEDMT